MKTCGKCVPVDEHRKLEKQWMGMCWLCVVLMAAVAVFGVLGLHWRSENVDLKHSLDNATQQMIDKDRAAFQATKRPRK